MISRRGRNLILKDSLIFQLISILLMKISVDNFCSSLQLVTFPVTLIAHLLCFYEIPPFRDSHSGFIVFVKGSLVYSLTLAIQFSCFEEHVWRRFAVVTASFIFAVHIYSIYIYGENEEREERTEYRRGMEGFLDISKDLRDRGEFQRPDDKKWKRQRKLTIKTLKELRKKLDTTCVECNKWKSRGVCAEMLGGAAKFFAIFELFGYHWARYVVNFGNLITHSGAAVEGVSNVAESWLSKKYLAEVLDVLEKDQKLTRPLMDWLSISRNLDLSTEKLFGCKLTSSKLPNVLKTFNEFALLLRNGNGFLTALDHIKSGQYSVYLGAEVKVEYLEKFFTLIKEKPEFTDNLRYALSYISQSVKILQCGRAAIAVYRDVCGDVESIGLPNLRGGISPKTPTVGKVSAFCVFQAIKIAVDFFSYREIEKVINERKSVYSDPLKKLSKRLKSELRSMEAASA